MAGSLAAGRSPISEKDFVCRGSGGERSHRGKTYEDCAGGHLPEGGIRPELLALLNGLQDGVGPTIEVTSGYRCEAHNAYSWAVVAAETGDEGGVSRDSLHRAGAAADFRAPGVRDPAAYRGFEQKLRALAGSGKVWTKTYGAREVRDPDNRHDHPYVHVHLLGVKREAKKPLGK